MDNFDEAHILTGRCLLRGLGTPDLEDDVELWRSVWESKQGELLPKWVAQHPGSRPRAWHIYDAWEYDDIEDFENETTWLYRLGLIGDEELAGIQRKAQDLAKYNAGRSPDDAASNFSQPDDVHVFAADHGLLSVQECDDLLGQNTESRMDSKPIERTRKHVSNGTQT